MTDVLAIHGAFRGAWAWDRVTPILAAQDIRLLAPDLPAAGASWFDGHPAVSMDDYAHAVVAATAGLDAPMLVGHSQGGVVARVALERAPGAFSGIAYLDAPIPEDGLRAIDLQPPALAGRVPGDLDPSMVVPPTPLEPGPGLPAADAAWINGRLTPQPVGPSLTPIVLEDPRARDLPTFVAFCSGTPETFPAWRTRSRMDAEGTAYDVLDGPHDIAIVAPETVAGWIAGCLTRV